jgi:phosphomethylpyrimidine synthase
VTDVTPGYDHISSSIGGAMAGYFGADFLCYVTPGEHLRLPTPEDVHQGVVATRIAAHAADLARRNTKAWTWDREMSIARRELNWGKQLHLALDKRGVENDLLRLKKEGKKPCSMCGEYCAIKTIKKALS